VMRTASARWCRPMWKVCTDEMSTTLSSVLMKCLKPYNLCWWNVWNPLIYTDEICKTLSSILMKCIKPSLCGRSLLGADLLSPGLWVLDLVLPLPLRPTGIRHGQPSCLRHRVPSRKTLHSVTTTVIRPSTAVRYVMMMMMLMDSDDDV
jgi:hypothetical protein